MISLLDKSSGFKTFFNLFNYTKQKFTFNFESFDSFCAFIYKCFEKTHPEILNPSFGYY